ncbi:DNA-binding protein [Micromonospora zhanjiangensis]|uniref:DNA-binding protein n=1 Tax=Micromonospora zhanjiangensis TaxID=1522057 RepID=A0ABV8KML1_9ACTN
MAEEVMAMAEIAAFLGISRQRASTLAERPDFPAPIAHLTVGRVWSTADIRRYAARRRAELEGEAG